MSTAACTTGTITAQGTPPGPVPLALDPTVLPSRPIGFRYSDQIVLDREQVTSRSLSRTSNLVNRTYVHVSFTPRRSSDRSPGPLRSRVRRGDRGADHRGPGGGTADLTRSGGELQETSRRSRWSPSPSPAHSPRRRPASSCALTPATARGRRRFSGFHEVGHTFQPGYRQMTLFRCDPSPTRTSASQPERLADAAAAELLLPRRFFLRDLIEADSGWDGIEQLASHYDASLTATAFRAVHLAPRPTLLVVLEPGVRRKNEVGSMPSRSSA